jgi:hypothetical protein
MLASINLLLGYLYLAFLGGQLLTATINNVDVPSL